MELDLLVTSELEAKEISERFYEVLTEGRHIQKFGHWTLPRVDLTLPEFKHLGV